MELTTRSREALSRAQHRAVTDGNPQLEPVHLLAALVSEAEGIPAALLQALGVERRTRRQGRRGRRAAATRSGATASGPAASGALQRVLARAHERAQERGDSYVSTEHLLLALAECRR